MPTMINNPDVWEMYESLYFETIDPELAKEICVY